LEKRITVGVKNNERVMIKLPYLQPFFYFHVALDNFLLRLVLIMNRRMLDAVARTPTTSAKAYDYLTDPVAAAGAL
jgi:hypothetical protein